MLGRTCDLERNASKSSLPVGSWTSRIWSGRVSWFSAQGCAIKQLLQHRFASADLRYDGKNFLAVFGDSAIGCVIAIPAGGGVDGIKLRKVDRRNMPVDAVDKQPPPALPLPMGRRSRFLRQAVVDAKASVYHKHAICSIASEAEVNSFTRASTRSDRISSTQGLFVSAAGIERQLSRCPFPESDGVRFGSGGYSICKN